MEYHFMKQKWFKCVLTLDPPHFMKQKWFKWVLTFDPPTCTP